MKIQFVSRVKLNKHSGECPPFLREISNFPIFLLCRGGGRSVIISRCLRGTIFIFLFNKKKKENMKWPLNVSTCPATDTEHFPIFFPQKVKSIKVHENS